MDIRELQEEAVQSPIPSHEIVRYGLYPSLTTVEAGRLNYRLQEGEFPESIEHWTEEHKEDLLCVLDEVISSEKRESCKNRLLFLWELHVQRNAMRAAEFFRHVVGAESQSSPIVTQRLRTMAVIFGEASAHVMADKYGLQYGEMVILEQHSEDEVIDLDGTSDWYIDPKDYPKIRSIADFVEGQIITGN